jgi:hypothetical protein
MGKVLTGGYRSNKMMRFVVPLLAAMFATVAASAQEWGQVSTPTAGPPQSIGFYTAGCLQGAQALPLDGPGYEVIRISRNRYWGQPVTLDFIKTLSEKVRAAGQAPLYIGDIGQPRSPAMPATRRASMPISGSSASPGRLWRRHSGRIPGCARWCAPTTMASTTASSLGST